MIETGLFAAGLLIGLGAGGYLHYRFGNTVARVEKAIQAATDAMNGK